MSEDYVGLAEDRQEFANKVRAKKLELFCSLYNKYPTKQFYYDIINFYNNTSNFIDNLEEYDEDFYYAVKHKIKI